MKIITNPTDEQLQRLMNLIALPAVIDEESIGDRFYFQTATGSYFISDFTKWLQKKYPDVYNKAASVGDIDNIEYGFWWRIDGSDGDEGYIPFKKCAEYIYTHKDALEGVCKELKEYLDDFNDEFKEENGIDDERWLREYNPFNSEDEYRSEIAEFFKDVDFVTSSNNMLPSADDNKEDESIEATIFNVNTPDAKPGRKAVTLDEYDFTGKVINLIRYNADKVPTASQFVRSNSMLGVVKSLKREFKDAIEKAFVHDNPELKEVFKDLSKFDIPCFMSDNSYVICVDVTLEDFGYITLMCGAGDKNHSETLPVVFYVYWDGNNWRGFVPAKGNPINLKTKKTIAIDIMCFISQKEDQEYLQNTGFNWEHSFKNWTPDWEALKGQLYRRIVIE